MEGELPHITLNPEEMGEVLNRTPAMEQEKELPNPLVGVDMGHVARYRNITSANTALFAEKWPLIFSRSTRRLKMRWSMLKNLAPDDFDPSDYLREQAENLAINSLHEMNEENPKLGDSIPCWG